MLGEGLVVNIPEKVWPLNRRKELDLLIELVNLIWVLDSGSGFIKSIERCIEIAALLNKSHIQSEVRRSFVHFLQDKACGVEK